MSEILKQNDGDSSEKPSIPEHTIPLAEAEKNGAEKLDSNEELVQVALKNAESLKAKSKREEKFKELESKLVSPVEDSPDRDIVVREVKTSALDRYPNKMSRAATITSRLIYRASRVFIADQIINGSAPKIDDIKDTSRSAYIHAEWPPTLVKSYIEKRDFLESRRQEVAEEMSSFFNDHPEVTSADFEAAVVEQAENEYAKDRCANYCYYGFGIKSTMEFAFGITHGVDIDYLKKVTEEDNTEGTVNYRLIHE